jgi:hypothetical protein
MYLKDCDWLLKRVKWRIEGMRLKQEERNKIKSKYNKLALFTELLYVVLNKHGKNPPNNPVQYAIQSMLSFSPTSLLHSNSMHSKHLQFFLNICLLGSAYQCVTKGLLYMIIFIFIKTMHSYLYSLYNLHIWQSFGISINDTELHTEQIVKHSI